MFAWAWRVLGSHVGIAVMKPVHSLCFQSLLSGGKKDDEQPPASDACIERQAAQGQGTLGTEGRKPRSETWGSRNSQT